MLFTARLLACARREAAHDWGAFTPMPAPSPIDSFTALLNAELLKDPGGVKTLRVAAGKSIFQEGDAGDGMYVVDAGRVDIVIGAKGAEPRVLSRIGPGGIFGEMAIIDGQPRSAAACADCDSVLRFVPIDDVHRVFSLSPDLMFSLMRDFSNRMRESNARHVEELLEAGRLSLVGRFAQSVVHDLKNPLNIISVAADLAGADETSAESRAMAAGMIRREVKRLTTMVNEVLDFTRQTPGTVVLAPMAFRDFVRVLLDEVGPLAGDRGVKIVCETRPPGAAVQIDERRLVQAFYNLINNAADFMPHGGTVTLRFSLSDDELQVELEDTGTGIAPEIAERLFQPFATFGKKTGTGLGLSICKRIIEAHKGRIRARSEAGRGAIFVITLPLSK